MLNNIFDELNWEKAWREDESTGVNMMKAAGIIPERAFDKTAQKYNDQCFTAEGKIKIVKNVFEEIEIKKGEMGEGV